MIALLCPTRRRPREFKRMVDSVKDTTKTRVLVYGCTDAMDLYDYRAKDIEIADWIHGQDGLPTSYKWNMLADLAMGKLDNNLFMLAADDMVFTTPGWDRAIIDHYSNLPKGKKAHVYALRDSRDQDGTPHFIATREFITTMGWFTPPIFLHWWVDSWTVEIAKSAGCFTHFKDYGLTHDKPSDRGQGDETHNLIRSMGWRERDAYVAETCKDWLGLQASKLSKAVGFPYKYPLDETA